MKRFLLALAVIAPLGTGACNKPTPEDCRKAISNVEQLYGTEATARLADNEGETQNRTPGLGGIPVIGNLFKRRTTTRTTNHLLSSTGDLSRSTTAYRLPVFRFSLTELLSCTS